MGAIDDLALNDPTGNRGLGAALRSQPNPDYSELARRVAAQSAQGDALRNAPAPDNSAVIERLNGAKAPSTIADVAAGPGRAVSVLPTNSASAIGAAPASIGNAALATSPPPSGTNLIGRLAAKSMGAADVVDAAPRAADPGPIGQMASKAAAGPLESAALTTLRRAAPVVAAIPEAVNTAKVAADPNSTKTDVAVQAAEGATRVGASMAGASLGSAAGAAVGGPLAPVTGLVGGIAGGALGYMGGDQAIKSLRSALGLGPSPLDRIGQPAAQPASNVIPGANGSTVQVNADGSSQLASRPTSDGNADMGGPAFGTTGAGGWDAGGAAQVAPPVVKSSAQSVQPAQATQTAGAQKPPAQQAEPAANPFDGAVQMIRPGGNITYAVQGPNSMVELDPATYATYHAAVTKDPSLAARVQMTEAGPLVDGVAVPGSVFAAGHNAITQYINTLNTAQQTGLTPQDQIKLREQNLTHMLPANTPLDSAAGFGGLNGVPGQNAASGAEFLKTVPPALGNQIKALAEGKMAFPSGPAMKTPYWQSMMTAVSQYDPSFDGVNFGSRAATRKDFTSGKSAQSINAMNTVAGHLESLSDAADKLNNRSIPLWNSIANGVLNATGDPRVKQFEATKKAVVDELTRVWRGNGGSEGDIKTWAQSLDAANSPDQLHGVIGQLGELVGSKINAMGAQYRQGMGTAGQDIQLVTPKTKAVFEKLQKRAGGEPITAQAPTAQIPDAAIAHLKANPSLAPMFEQKYGIPAAQYLGQ